MSDEQITTGKLLTRADFLAASQKLKVELVEVPELGGAVYMRELSGKQKLAYSERITKLQANGLEVNPSNSLELMALLISISARDPNGDPMFTEEDVIALSENNPEVLLRLSSKAMELSGSTDKAITEVTENLKKVTSSSMDN